MSYYRLRGFMMTALIKAWADFTIAYRLPIIVGSIALLLVSLLLLLLGTQNVNFAIFCSI